MLFGNDAERERRARAFFERILGTPKERLEHAEHFTKKVIPESIYVGWLSAVYWAPRTLCSEYILAPIRPNPDKRLSLRGTIRQAGGYFPHLRNLRSPLHRHPAWNVWYQIGGNTLTHRTAEMFTDNLLIISFFAALGAAPGTQAIVKSVIQKGTASVPLRFKSAGLFCEVLREMGYNFGALNAILQVERLGLDSTPAKLAAVGVVSATAGAATGVFHALANTFYAGLPPQSLFNSRKALRGLRNSCLIRAGYIGLTFVTATALTMLWKKVSESFTTENDNNQNVERLEANTSLTPSFLAILWKEVSESFTTENNDDQNDDEEAKTSTSSKP